MVTSYIFLIFAVMKKNTAKYESVKRLPAGAVSVSTHCSDHNYTHAYLYKLIKEEKEGKKILPFKIVVFQGINFVVSK